MLHRSDNLAAVLGGKHFDFSAFAQLGVFTRVAVAVLVQSQSKSAIEETREETNVNLACKTRAFLRFAQNYKKAAFDRATCFAYRDYLKRTKTPLVQTAHYNTCASIMTHAMQQGYCEYFQVPRGLSFAKAMATSDVRKTLADHLKNYDNGSLTQNDVNRRILQALHEFCWKRVHQVRDRQRAGWRWKVEAEMHGVVKPDGSPAQWSREDLLRYIVQRHWVEAFGISNRNTRDEDVTELRRFTKRLLSRPSTRYHALTMREVNDHLLPTMEQITSFLPLFAMKRLNPASIARLKTSMLIDGADVNDRAKYIRVAKGRSGRELTFGPYMLGGDNARTTPRAFLILKEITDRIREHAEDRYRSYLVLRTHLRRRGSNQPFSAPCVLQSMLTAMKPLLKQDDDPRFDILRHIGTRWSLMAIRSTVLTTDRHRGTLRSTQSLAQHRRRETTTIYLNTPGVASMLDEQIEKGQTEMLQSIKAALKIITANVEAISEEVGCGPSTARDVLNEKMNLGFGVSLVDEHAFVVDTPLNYLRMETWLKRIEMAQARIEANNPDRWDAHWRPQIDLFRQALSAFPRKTALEADKMRMTVRLTFPEPE